VYGGRNTALNISMLSAETRKNITKSKRRPPRSRLAERARRQPLLSRSGASPRASASNLKQQNSKK
jgi:hypothetical protein